MLVTYYCKACDHSEKGCRLTVDDSVEPPEDCPFFSAEAREMLDAYPVWRRVVSIADELPSLVRFHDKNVDSYEDGTIGAVELPEWFYNVSCACLPRSLRFIYALSDAFQDDQYDIKPDSESEVKKILAQYTKKEIAEECTRFGFTVGLWYDQHRLRIEKENDPDLV